MEENRDNILRDITRLVAVPSVEGAPEPGAPFGPGPKAALAKALEIADRSIVHSIRETVEGTPSLRERYRRACELQKKIDERKAAGRKIPAAWISNPFHLKYYGDAGKLE